MLDVVEQQHMLMKHLPCSSRKQKAASKLKLFRKSATPMPDDYNNKKRLNRQSIVGVLVSADYSAFEPNAAHHAWVACYLCAKSHSTQ